MACWVKRVDGRDFRHDFRPNRHSDCGGFCAAVGVGHHHAYFKVSARSCRHGVGLTHSSRRTIQQPFGHSIKRSACINAFEQHGSTDACRRFSLNAWLRRIEQGEIQDRDAVATVDGLNGFCVAARFRDQVASEFNGRTRRLHQGLGGRFPQGQIQRHRAVASMHGLANPVVDARCIVSRAVPSVLVACFIGQLDKGVGVKRECHRHHAVASMDGGERVEIRACRVEVEPVPQQGRTAFQGLFGRFHRFPNRQIRRDQAVTALNGFVGPSVQSRNCQNRIVPQVFVASLDLERVIEGLQQREFQHRDAVTAMHRLHRLGVGACCIDPDAIPIESLTRFLDLGFKAAVPDIQREGNDTVASRGVDANPVNRSRTRVQRIVKHEFVTYVQRVNPFGGLHEGESQDVHAVASMHRLERIEVHA